MTPALGKHTFAENSGIAIVVRTLGTRVNQAMRQATDAARRGGWDELSAWAVKQLAQDPRCAVARYLLGCHCLDRGRPAQATRHLMVASHAEPRLESAALLVFAGLRWTSHRNSLLLPALLETWELFRRPEFDRTPIERRLLDLFETGADAGESISPLAKRLSRLPIQAVRAQIHDAVQSRDMRLGQWLLRPA